MAEIKIEKKRPVWPWILLILGIAALIYFLVFRDADTDLIDDQEDINDVELRDTIGERNSPKTLQILA
ncbi:MAG: hypothetical protein ITG00_05880 [Flavobacterium sp.]|nr:hypothetical protein [Flavobacterium sp.]